MRLVAGIDLSTQSCTVEVRDIESFEVVGRARVPLAETTPPVSEQAAEDWWLALVAGFQQLRLSNDLSGVEAMAASGQCHGLVALNRNDVPVRPVKLWNDTTSAPQISALVKKFGPEYWATRTGSVPTAAFTISKLAWLIEKEPERVQSIEHILLPHDYLTFRLTGKYVTDRSEASGTGYFNSQSNQYDFELLRACFGDVLPWESIFPSVGKPDDIAGYLSESASRQLGLRAGIPVTVGGGDQHMAALGLGIEDGDVVISLGTSGVVYTSSRRPITTGRVDGVANVTGGWLPLICTLNSTKVTDWAARILGVSVKELDVLADQALKKRTTVPTLAPYLDGERTPAYPSATGVLAGITTATGREEFALSAYYGVVLGLVRGLGELRESGVEIGGRYVAVGGGSRSEVYMQVCADLFRTRIEAIHEPEVTARGACLQALAHILNEPVTNVGKQFRPSTAGIFTPRNDTDFSEMWRSYLDVCNYASTTSHLRNSQVWCK